MRGVGGEVFMRKVLLLSLFYVGKLRYGEIKEKV